MKGLFPCLDVHWRVVECDQVFVNQQQGIAFGDVNCRLKKRENRGVADGQKRAGQTIHKVTEAGFAAHVELPPNHKTRGVNNHHLCANHQAQALAVFRIDQIK